MKGVVGSVVAGLVTGELASSGTQDGSENTFGGAFGGGIGGMVTDLMSPPSIGNSFKPISGLLKGGLAGLAGGLTQDVTNAILKPYICINK